jgi:hypothetical protein
LEILTKAHNLIFEKSGSKHLNYASPLKSISSNYHSGYSSPQKDKISTDQSFQSGFKISSIPFEEEVKVASSSTNDKSNPSPNQNQEI